MHNRSITFFCSDECEFSLARPLMAAAGKMRISFGYTYDLKEEADIGVYLPHICGAYARNSRFSAVMLHDLAQGSNRWPDIWASERWQHFDIGFLPNLDWQARWESVRFNEHALPKQGMFVSGWPKADPIVARRKQFEAKAVKLRERMGLQYETSVLYAPSWEYGDKQDDFVRALVDKPLNLLIKQAPWPAIRKAQLAEIERMRRLHDGAAPNIHIISPQEDIMHCLALADVLVSDESSVIVEALALGVPALWVSDWLIPDTMPARPAGFPFGFAFRTEKALLADAVDAVLNEREKVSAMLIANRERFFPYMGSSSERTIKTIMSMAETGRAEGNLLDAE